jgi:hypothetical protein
MTREKASRAAFYEGEFTLEDLTFRPFSAATKLHLESLGIGEELPDDDDDEGWADMIVAMAYCQWAPLEEINDLCFEIDEAENEAAAAIHRKKFRRGLLTFKSRLTGDMMIELAKRMTAIISNQQRINYDLAEKPAEDIPGDESPPPGNE